MADDGSQQRKPDFQSVLEDVKALATVLVMQLESVLGRRLHLRSPAVLAAIGIIATLVLALVVVLLLGLTGGTKHVTDNAALIGALVALGGVFTAQMVSIALDDRRSHEERDLEAQRAGEAALQKYIEAVGKLLIEQSLREASPGDNLSTLVRAQTLSVLEGLDPDRKRILLLFLYESGLIRERELDESGVMHERKPVVSLVGANLNEANLRNANLSGVNLSKAFLNKANLSSADLSYANLSETNLGRTDLSKATLIDTNLSGAYLTYVNLSSASLTNADLSRAWLAESDLSGAVGCTEEQLAKAKYLQGTTMPDRRKYEDWIQDKEGSGKDAETE